MMTEVPANDSPLGSVMLTVGMDFNANAVTGTNVNATASELADPGIADPGCGGYSGGDLWYSVIVPGDGNLTIETAVDSGSSLDDTGIAVYSGPVGALVLEACNDDGGTGTFSRLDLTGLVPGETLYIRVWEFGNDVFDTFQVSAWNIVSSPSNDDPVGAIPLTPGVDFDANAVTGTNVNATASEVVDPTIPPSGCEGYFGGDVWYSVVVPGDGNITVETAAEVGSTLDDTVIAVYSGPIGAFVLEACNDDFTGLFSRIDLTGFTPGETLYIRVWEFGNNTFDTFLVSTWNPMILSVDAPEFDSFTYYPNPVEDILYLSTERPIQHISMYNLSGQEVLRKDKDIQSSSDVSGLPAGTYLMRVVIDNKEETFKVLKK